MSNNIKKDLALFNELVSIFIEDELENPVAEYINPKNLEKELDIKLREEGMGDDEFKKSLKELLLKTPKSSSKLFFNT